MDLSYVLEKIKDAEFSYVPFKHLDIRDLFEQSDFEEIIRSPEVSVPAAHDDHDLLEILFANGYKIISFPGCMTDFLKYEKWHTTKEVSHRTNTSCEGFGIVFRLKTPKSTAICGLQEFINSQEFVDCLLEKFDLENSECVYDTGIQKYLDGYEISPHPDIRRKALTYMVNINPSLSSAEDNHHTAYLRFKPEWNYVGEYWKGNQKEERFWVPWDWCEVYEQQSQNNSMVVFSPAEDTLHAVKANYNHLVHQRTQLYGNLWYTESPCEGNPKWEDFLIKAKLRGRLTHMIIDGIKKFVPRSAVNILRTKANRTNSKYIDYDSRFDY